MKAIKLTEFGSPDVLHLTDIEKPVPAENEILIRIHATHVNFGDIVARKFNQLGSDEFHMPAPLLFLSKFAFGFSKPKVNILGSEFSGKVEAAGEAVSRFKAGMRCLATGVL